MEKKDNEPTFGGRVKAFYGAAYCLSNAMLPWIRRPRTIGPRAFGSQTLIGLAMMFLVIASTNPEVAGLACGLTLVLIVFHKCGEPLNPDEHSGYTGVPILPGEELSVKRVKEPLFLFFMGIAALPFCPGLGVYLMLGGGSLAVVHDHWRRRLDAQVRAIRDSRIEANIVRDLYERKY